MADPIKQAEKGLNFFNRFYDRYKTAGVLVVVLLVAVAGLCWAYIEKDEEMSCIQEKRVDDAKSLSAVVQRNNVVVEQNNRLFRELMRKLTEERDHERIPSTASPRRYLFDTQPPEVRPDNMRGSEFPRP